MDKTIIGEQFTNLNYRGYTIYPQEGKIWSNKSNRYVGKMNDRGYWDITIRDNDGNTWRTKVHRIIYATCYGDIPIGMQVNHIDEDKSNNSISNLNLMTPKENTNWGSGKEKSAKSRTNGKLSKKVEAYKDGKLVMTFPSTKEAQRQGYGSGGVSLCCRGKQKEYMGYKWIYADNKKGGN